MFAPTNSPFGIVSSMATRAALTEELEGLVRSKDAARYLCMSEWQLRALAHSGQLAYIQRTPRSPLLFDRADLRAWIEREKIRK